MPYTPPARSPASSGSTSPAYSLSQSYMNHSSPPRSPALRPQLPRSANSATYLQKSRRSPAYQLTGKEQSRLESGRSATEVYEQQNGHNINPSLRQSPPPVTDSSVPPMAIMSPPDSAQNSSDDEEISRRTTTEDLEELEKDLRSRIHVDRVPASPDDDHLAQKNDSQKLAIGDASTEVTRPAIIVRKTSHGRSATESSFFDQRRRDSVASSTTSTSDASDDEDDSVVRSKPPLLRKKSGELVKPAIRASSRRRHSSMPGTPTFSKAVHFNEEIEQVRHFLQVDRPITVSAGTSPVETYDDEQEFPFSKDAKSTSVSWEIRLANFPRQTYERDCSPIRVEKIRLSDDEKSLLGDIAVANWGFQKLVIARFTLDYWKTTSEIVAEYTNGQQRRDDGCDMFNFSIKLSDQANLETRTLLLCARYNVNGQEWWDSNDGQNFQVDFIKNVKVSNVAATPVQPAAHGVGSRPPRSRHNSSSSVRSRIIPSIDDDFGNNFDTNSTIRFRNPSASKPLLPDTPPPMRRHNGASQQFGSRYDFGASLTAALSHAQAQLGDRSGLKIKTVSQTEPSTPRTQPRARPHTTPGSAALKRTGFFVPPTSGTESPRPEALLANQQSLDSRAYQDFVSKFCFFGTPKNNASHGSKQPANTTDGAQDDVSPTAIVPPGAIQPDNHSKAPSYVNSAPQSFSPTSSGTSSPSHTDSDITPRARSPVRYNFPLHRDSHTGIFPTDAHTPTAIQG